MVLFPIQTPLLDQHCDDRIHLLDTFDEVVAHGTLDKLALICLELLSHHFLFLLRLDALLVSLQLLQVLFLKLA